MPFDAARILIAVNTLELRLGKPFLHPWWNYYHPPLQTESLQVGVLPDAPISQSSSSSFSSSSSNFPDSITRTSRRTRTISNSRACGSTRIAEGPDSEPGSRDDSCPEPAYGEYFRHEPRINAAGARNVGDGVHSHRVAGGDCHHRHSRGHVAARAVASQVQGARCP